MDALAATSAGFGRTPGFCQVGDDQRLNAAAHDVPGMGAFNFIAYPHAPGAEHAPVVIDREAVMRGIHFQIRIAIAKVNVRDIEFLSERLQFAVPVRDANRANMIALREKQLENGATVALQALRAGSHFHAFLDQGDTGRQEFVRALHLDQAQAASTCAGEPFQVAQA